MARARASVRGYTLLEAPYEFGIDNLMDLSHIEFVHKGSFAGAGVIFAGKHEVIERDGHDLVQLVDAERDAPRHIRRASTHLT